MGFDINVTLTLQMCKKTGKPFYYGRNKETGYLEKLYGLPSVEVPPHLVQYLVGRGHHFYSYTKTLEVEDLGFNVSAGTFLQYYPSWEDVQQDEEYSDENGWEEEDHNNFKALLEWCENSGLDFNVSWSY